ncbi:RNA polymerase II degradation factor 1 isoform X1 [Drosophila eugracilis]|uniref:RNA polymerase II degradation factor 1 isoform X1 n=1 Tax=Drosophila eugracilis TaxID=29029 RepID=UPI001BDADF17|nr:RNA polymerase II degradation factor 1 isoform X1 [Drosophila eugracilis]
MCNSELFLDRRSSSPISIPPSLKKTLQKCGAGAKAHPKQTSNSEKRRQTYITASRDYLLKIPQETMKMWTESNVNSAMGLQATAATKRKHELTFDSKDANTTYTGNCAPPPVKANKWAISNNNYLESLEEQQQQQQSPTEPAVESNNNHIVLDTSMDVMKPTESSISNGHEVTTAVAALKSQAEVPLPPTASAAIPEDSIARLEVVTSAVSCEPWASNGSSTPSAVSGSNGSVEPVDCISKLQAVAVPSDPWGSIATRSTLATTLLSADELDDDDDDFEDDYEEEESIIPTYCPMRYHPFVPHPHPHQLPPHPHQQQQQQQRYPHRQPQIGILPLTDNVNNPHSRNMNGGHALCQQQQQQLTQQQPHPQQQQQLAQQQQQQRSYAPGYGNRQPNYYSEPFPQQNCSRTGGPQHMTQSPPSPQQARGFAPPQWATAGSTPANPSVGAQQFYEASNGGGAYAPPAAPQQTIRCAENGKSYLDLGCSSGATAGGSPISPPPSSAPVVPFAGLPIHGLPLKRCCDGRPGGWCSANRSCYKDTRLKIRNLSMFKLSRFRQVSEQSLYRSVLICNTLKRIDREIEAEAKELHQAAQQHHQQAAAAAAQYHPAYQQQQQQSSPAPLHPHPQQQQQQQQQMDYAPVINCARLANMDHYQQLSFQPQQPPQPHGYHERLESQPAYRGVATGTGGFTTQPSNCDTSAGASSNTSVNSNNSSATTATAASGSSSLHPYDHYPFRESQSGRATPFPACPTTTAAAASGGPASTLSNSNISSSPATSSSSNSSSSTVMSSSSGNTASSSANTPVAPAASSTNCDTSDSGYADDDSTRSINWSSVLSLSSQSALDPLNNNDLFSILPAATTPTAVPVSVPASSSSSSSGSTLAFSGSFTTVQASSGNSSSCGSSSTTATFTTLSTISSATHSLTSSYVSSISSNVSAGANTWEYGFLDMEFGLGSEFTELVPSCKLSSEDLFKSGLGGQVVAASRLHDNELEQPAHIMVGS